MAGIAVHDPAATVLSQGLMSHGEATTTGVRVARRSRTKRAGRVARQVAVIHWVPGPGPVQEEYQTKPRRKCTTMTESMNHDRANCEHRYHEKGDSEGEGCWRPDCMYGPGIGPPDDDEDVYRAHVGMTGMAPPHGDGTWCECLFPRGGMRLAMDPGSPAERTYKAAHVDYLSMMRPVWQEVGAPEFEEGDPGVQGGTDFFRAVIAFDAKMRAMTTMPLYIVDPAEAEAYLDARNAVVRPDCE